MVLYCNFRQLLQKLLDETYLMTSFLRFMYNVITRERRFKTYCALHNFCSAFPLLCNEL